MLRICVTGTNGKTTTCTWIEAVLGSRGDLVAGVRNTGYTLSGEVVAGERTLQGFREFESRMRRRGVTALVVEVTSKALVGRFADSWPCDVAVLTNITHDHLDLHTSLKSYVAAKARLFAALNPDGIAVLNATDPATLDVAEVIRPSVRQLWYGLEERRAHTPLSVKGRVRDMTYDRTDLDLLTSPQPHGLLTVPAPGLHFAENALATWAACVSVGRRPDDIAEALATAPRPPGRFDVVSRSPTVVVDFAHSPDALERTIATIKLLNDGRLIVVLGAGGDKDPTKRPGMGRAVSAANEIILTSDNPRSEDPEHIARQIEEGIVNRGAKYIRTVIDRREAIDSAIARAEPGDAVLIAGRGGEQYQTVGARTIPFNDRTVAVQALIDAGHQA